jgi:formylglycine-generating enzyme required for sulfatase activity
LKKKKDPTGPKEGDMKVLRGGNWRSFPADCRSSARQHNMTDTNWKYFGFRIIMERNDAFA